MSRKNMVIIDGDKLMAQLGKNGIDPRDLSEELGHSRDYMQSAYRDGRIGRPEAMTLEKAYGIPLDSYEWIENEQKELPILAEGSPSNEADIKDILTELYQTIKAAVKDAIREEKEEHEQIQTA